MDPARSLRKFHLTATVVSKEHAADVICSEDAPIDIRASIGSSLTETQRGRSGADVSQLPAGVQPTDAECFENTRAFYNAVRTITDPMIHAALPADYAVKCVTCGAEVRAPLRLKVERLDPSMKPGERVFAVNRCIFICCKDPACSDAVFARMGGGMGDIACSLEGCGKHGTPAAPLQMCAKCKAVYCSRAHQIVDWPEHKASCKAAKTHKSYHGRDATGSRNSYISMFDMEK